MTLSLSPNRPAAALTARPLTRLVTRRRKWLEFTELNTRELGLTGLRGWLAAAPRNRGAGPRAADRPNLSG